MIKHKTHPGSMWQASANSTFPLHSLAVSIAHWWHSFLRIFWKQNRSNMYRILLISGLYQKLKPATLLQIPVQIQVVWIWAIFQFRQRWEQFGLLSLNFHSLENLNCSNYILTFMCMQTDKTKFLLESAFTFALHCSSVWNSQLKCYPSSGQMSESTNSRLNF